MPRPYWEIISGCWFVFWVYWSLGVLGIRAPKRKVSFAFTVLNTGLLYIGFVLVLAGHMGPQPLALRFTSDTTWIDGAGTVLVVAGIALAIWSRRVLGANWSGAVKITENQHLICIGPYAVVRNPIYTGIALAVFGTALVAGTVAGVIGFALVVVSFWLKGRREERLLLVEFGDEYAAYRARTKSMIPFIL